MRHKNGFTIIEVMIVLAIAGLIMLLIFLAVPAMQRNARNHLRRTDAGALMAATAEKMNNTGQLPISCNNRDNLSCYVREVNLGYYDNKSTTENYVSFWNRTGVSAPLDQLDPNDNLSRERVIIRSGAACDNTTNEAVAASQHQLSAQIVIETGNGNALQCINF